MAQHHLTRNDIVRAAITFVDAQGLDALTTPTCRTIPQGTLSDLLREDHRRRQFDDALDELIERLRPSPTTATSHSSLS